VLDLDVDRVRFPDGSVGELEIIRHPGASAIVALLDPSDAADPRVLLIRQYRYATDGFIYEIPAGRLDTGESPESCAGRELREETGYTAEKLERVFSMYTTPGFTDERIHVFLATGLTPGASQREPDEFVEVMPTPLSQVLAMIRDNVLTDAKSALGILYVAGYVLGA